MISVRFHLGGGNSEDNFSVIKGWVIDKILAQNVTNLVGAYYIEYVGQ